MAPASPDRPWTPATDASGAIIAGPLPAAASVTSRTFVLPANREVAEIPGEELPQRAEAYSLAELVDAAASRNPSTRVAWNDARRAALAAGIVRSTYLPQLAATALGGYHYSRNTYLSDGSGADLSGGGAVAAISLQWLLFDFGERAALLDAAEQSSLISNIAFTAAHQKVIYDVSMAFYAYQAAVARVQTASTSLNNALKIQEAAEQSQRRGVATVIEVSQARLASAQAKLAVVISRGKTEDVYQDLMAAVGVSPLTRVRVVEVTDRKLPEPNSASLERVIKDALARRPDVLAAYSGLQAQRALVRGAEAAFQPKIFFYANQGYYHNSLGVSPTPIFGQGLPTINLQGLGWAGGVFVGLSIPLYDGGMRAAQVSQAQAAASNAAVKFDQTRQTAVRQIMRSNNALDSSLETWHAANALKAASQITFDAALEALRNGLGTTTAVHAAEIQLLSADSATTDAYSAALSAAATLALAVGSMGRAP